MPAVPPGIRRGFPSQPMQTGGMDSQAVQLRFLNLEFPCFKTPRLNSTSLV